MAAQSPVSGCSRHERMFAFVCKTCDDKLICMDCVTDDHNGHFYGDLQKFEEEHKRDIQQCVDKLSEADIPNIEKAIRKCDTKDGRYQKLIDAVKHQGKELKDGIDDVIDFMANKCAEVEKRNISISEGNKTALIEHLKTDLKPKLGRYQGILTSGKVDDITDIAREIRSASNVSPTSRSLKAVDLTPEKISTDRLARIIGSILVDGEEQLYKPIPKTVALSEFVTQSPYRTCRTLPSGDEAWLSNWDSESLHRVDLNGNVKETVECKVKVQSMSVSPSTGRIWFCVWDDKTVREITSDGAIEIRFEVKRTPSSLCITVEDMVVVAMVGTIQLYTPDGQEVEATAYGPCRQEANWPHHMAFCPTTGYIAAVDSENIDPDNYKACKTPGQPSHVIIMDRRLNLKFRCTDNGTNGPEGSSDQSAQFYDACFDGVGDLLVTDYVTRSVLLIDFVTGHRMRTVYTGSDCHIPLTVSLHQDGKFWIGHEDKKMEIYNYE